jgi:hypothetical protein
MISVRGCVIISAPAPAETYKQVDRLVSDRAAADAQVRAVFPQRRVQRGKDVAADVGITAQVLLDAIRRAAFGRSADHAAIDGQQRADLQALGRLLKIGKLGAKWPLTKTNWQAAPGTRNFSICAAETVTLPLHRALKRRLRQRREIGEAPVLVVRGRKSLGAEARPCRPRAVAAATPDRAPAGARSVRHTLRDMYSNRPSGRRRHCFLVFLA